MSLSQVKLGNADKTLELLWSRIRQRGHLPGFSKAVSAVTNAMRGEDDREFNMTKTVLSDPALTQRVLRLANSAMYSVFGQNINTVSKAVIVLGTDSIGHLALGLRLIDGLSSGSSESDGARGEMEKAVLAGHIARQVASSASSRDIEEAVVCSMLHSLGRMMAVFYLSEQWSMVQARSADTDISEAEAVQDILGIGLDELGRRVAQQWGLPAAIVNSMQNFPPQSLDEPLAHADWLAAVSTMSGNCAEILREDTVPIAELVHVAEGYTDMLGIDISQILTAVETAKTTAAEEAIFAQPAKSIEAVKSTVVTQHAGKPSDAAMLLTKGVADMRGISASVSSAQMVAMALETVFKGLGLSRAVCFLRNADQAQYVASLGFGDGVQEIIPRLAFSDAYQPDVFHAALANDKIIFVENAKAPTFVNKLPRWWKEALPSSRSFLILPLMINRQPAGFIYGDWDMSLPLFKIEPSEIPALDELRAMVVLAIEQRRKVEPSWMI